MRRSRAIGALVLICALICSSARAGVNTDVDPNAGNITKPTTTSSPPASPLFVRSDWNYPPFEYLNPAGEPEGFNIDIIRAVARVMDIDIIIDLGPWDEVRGQLEQGEIDAIAGMYKTPERDKTVDFSIPHLIVSYAVFVRADSEITSVQDLAQKTIIVQNKDLGHDYVLEHNIGKSLITCRNWEEVLRALSQGQGDCAIVSRLQGVRLIDQLNIDNVRPVGPPIIQRKYCIAVKEGDDHLLYAINEGLSIIKTTGEYDRIYEKWFKIHEDGSLDYLAALKYLSWILIPVILLVGIVLVWSWSLQRQVRLKTMDLENELQERRRTEAALRESEARFRRLTENAQDLIYRMSLPDGRYEYINDASRNIIGLSPREIMEKPAMISKMIHPDSREFFEKAWDNLLKGIAPTTYEYKIIDTFGNTRWLFQRNVLVRDNNGTPIAIEGIVTDITRHRRAEEERAELEAQLHRAEKMETVGTLAGGVAHDLNNVLGAIVGYPDLLLQDLPQNSPLAKSISAIKASGEKAALIVQDLLTLARRGVPSDEVVNVNQIITHYLESRECRRLLDQSPGTKIRTRLEPQLLNILGSPVHLSKIIMNLVQNAGEAITGEGTILISTENIYLDRAVKGYDTVKEGDYILVKVSDTGIGISEKDLKHIFEPFYTRKMMGHSGSGLGMAIVWSAVKDHKGYIDIESAQNKGTTVLVYFPVTRTETAEDEPRRFELSLYQGHGEKILIIDDIDTQRDVAASMLQKLNYRTESVGSGEEALQYLQTHSADLLLLDMILDTGMDGLETYRQILKIRPAQKAIIASGFSETDRVRETLALGANAYIQKPFTLEILAKTIQAALQT